MFDTSRDYHCFLVFQEGFAFVGCSVNFLKMIMNKIWIQNRVLNLSGHISISRKLWIHQTGWMVFPLTYRTWAKSLFHFLMDTMCSSLDYQNMLCIPRWDFFVKWLIPEFDKEVVSSLHCIFDQKVFETNLNFTNKRVKNLKKLGHFCHVNFKSYLVGAVIFSHVLFIGS